MYALKTIMLRLLAVFLVVGLGDQAAASPQITSHAAIYDVRLGSATGANAPAGLSGSMVYAVNDTCDGYRQDSTLDITIRDRRGNQSALRQSFTSFESEDQTESSFQVRISSSGRDVDSYSGQINTQPRGGSMVYDRPDGDDRQRVYSLPPDTRLSLAFTDEVIAQAKAGKPFVSRVVADGLLEDGPHRISAVVGRQLASVPEVEDAENLLTAPPWPVQLAYYATGDNSELPTEEMRVELFDGGIVGKITQDMGDYTVVSTLIEVQAVPGCE